jgi:hypothetical protein
MVSRSKFHGAPRSHGLYFQDENIQVFIPGIEKEEK